jgi:hypothetical protein
MSRHEIKRHDTRPYWPVSLEFDDGSFPDITSATISMLCRNAGDSTLKFKDSATVWITDGANGELEWRPTADQVDTAGRFDIEWEVVFPDGTQQTFPTRGYDRLTVVGDLG